ncbi:MAG: histidine--tRNA ligase [Clostridia bacterium]|nr:histidine--tRNA ligase [Clostridia bacterium]
MINIPKGTKDCLPEESYKWHFLEDKFRKQARVYNFKEIRTPVFEHTELFLRGVGDTTDIVNKEMYTFLDKGERSITLKPEGTAGVARSFIENGLDNNPQPTKMYYITPVFRYEQPQAGRLREHHQFGIELYGSESYKADFEVISFANNFLECLGLKNLELNINSIGCPTCRAEYKKALIQFFSSKEDQLCSQCRERLQKNPLRVLDCKVPTCKEIAKGAPSVIDYLCQDCKAHHENLTNALSKAGIKFKVNPNIVRGLDYYTRTVFEFISNDIGSQGTVCGGGRYNNLVEEIGGKSTPAVGFGMGIERLIMVLENANAYLGEKESPLFYILPITENESEVATLITNKLRVNGINCETDLCGRSLKAQMKYANKINAKYVIVIGGEEITNKKVTAKNMFEKQEIEIDLDKLIQGDIDIDLFR